MKRLLQIVPDRPGSFGGVSDYALNIARELRVSQSIETSFCIFSETNPGPVEDFPVLPFHVPGLDLEGIDLVLFHYVNYAYQPRGVPRWLLPWLQRTRATRSGARWLTFFHELYASGPPWRSAFWLQGVQKQIASALASRSDVSLVSNPIVADQLQALAPGATITLQPISSNFGESDLTLADLAARDPQRWVICGGPALVRRSLSSFLKLFRRLPPELAPKKLTLFGGRPDGELLARLQAEPSLETVFLPALARDEAAAVLRESALAWLDYFDRPDRPMEILMKSSIFTACCAHGVLPVFPHPLKRYQGGSLPDPAWISPREMHLPSAKHLPQTAFTFHQWYRERAGRREAGALIAKLAR